MHETIPMNQPQAVITVHLIGNHHTVCGLELHTPVAVTDNISDVTCIECMTCPAFGQALDNS